MSDKEQNRRLSYEIIGITNNSPAETSAGVKFSLFLALVGDSVHLCGHGILVTDLGERVGLPFQAGGNIVTWFSLLLYR